MQKKKPRESQLRGKEKWTKGKGKRSRNCKPQLKQRESLMRPSRQLSVRPQKRRLLWLLLTQRSEKPNERNSKRKKKRNRLLVKHSKLPNKPRRMKCNGNKNWPVKKPQKKGEYWKRKEDLSRKKQLAPPSLQRRLKRKLTNREEKRRLLRSKLAAFKRSLPKSRMSSVEKSKSLSSKDNKRKSHEHGNKNLSGNKRLSD